MMNHKHRKSWISIIALVLAAALLPLSATALTEDKLEAAPESTAAPQAAAGSAYLPTAGKPWNRETVSADEKEDKQFTADGFSRPWLSDLELARTRRLMEQAAAGEVSYTGPSVVNASVDAFRGVGVYPLNPADYDGETFYVLLPQYSPLTDEQILSLIAAFDELGIPFDPDSLGSRNCCRNTYQDYSRYLTEEEQERLDTITALVRRGALTVKDIPEGTLDCYIPAARSNVAYDKYFMVYPYRSMTDDELSLLALHTDSRWEDDPQEIERLAIEAVRTWFPDPGVVSVYQMTRGSCGELSEGNYTILYTVELMSETTLESRKAGAPLYMTVDLMKEPGHAPEISYMEQTYEQGYLMDKNLPASTRDEWIAAAKAWAEANLKFPDGKTPQAWDVEYAQDFSPDPEEESYWFTGLSSGISAVLPEWELSIRIWQNSCTVQEVRMMSRKWAPLYNHESGEKDYMPSDARPGYREPVSADEKTDPQMVIRHTDYHAEEDGFFLPWLTDLELARTRRLMEQMAAGEVTYTGPSAVNASGDMNGRVGVYPLNPEDYDGERVYVLLPQYETLTDEQILSLIAAFDELGIPFDPESLNGRNCSRNMWYRQTRELSVEEEGMMEAVRDSVRRGEVTRESIPAGTPDYYVEMDWDGDNASFWFYPYRRMTYNEMALLALHEDGAWEDTPETVEKIATDAAFALVRNPGEMKIWQEEMYESSFDREGVITYGVYMDNAKDSWGGIWRILVYEKKEAGNTPEIGSIYVMYSVDSPSGQYYPEKTDDDFIAAAKAWAEENLEFPDGQAPDRWRIDRKNDANDPAYRSVVVKGEMPEWTVYVVMFERNLEVQHIELENNRWKPEEE